MKALSIVLASSLFLHVVAYDKYSDLYDAIDSEKYQYTSRSDRGIFSNALEGNEPFARIELSAKAMIFDIDYHVNWLEIQNEPIANTGAKLEILPQSLDLTFAYQKSQQIAESKHPTDTGIEYLEFSFRPFCYLGNNQWVLKYGSYKFDTTAKTKDDDFSFLLDDENIYHGIEEGVETPFKTKRQHYEVSYHFGEKVKPSEAYVSLYYDHLERPSTDIDHDANIQWDFENFSSHADYYFFPKQTDHIYGIGFGYEHEFSDISKGWSVKEFFMGIEYVDEEIPVKYTSDNWSGDDYFRISVRVEPAYTFAVKNFLYTNRPFYMTFTLFAEIPSVHLGEPVREDYNGETTEEFPRWYGGSIYMAYMF